MLSGKIDISWTSADYENLDYRKHPDPGRGASYLWNDETSLDGSKLENGLSNAYSLPTTITSIKNNFKFKKMSLAVQKYDPGQLLPWHRDLYATYKKFNHITASDTIVRVIVFLHDDAPGHQLWIEDKFCTGKKGDYYGWYGDALHMAANLGTHPRYNLQITGIL